MGAFLLIRRHPEEPDRDVSSRFKDARRVLARKGLQSGTTLTGPDFQLELLPKLNQAAPQVLDRGAEGFLACTGTLIYQGRYGVDALGDLASDFHGDWSLLSTARGNFCLFVYRDAKLCLVTDIGGLYPVYVDRELGVASNSFLAVHRAATSRSLRAQETYEFVLHGAFYADATPVQGIDRAPSGAVLTMPDLTPGQRYATLEPTTDTPRSKRLVDWVTPVHERLQAVFADVTAAFGDHTCTALSGGFDTRLQLAHLRSHDCVPRYLYVYGKETDPDVRVARKVAAAEGLELDHPRALAAADRDPQDFQTTLRDNFYLYDGLGTTISGVFQTDDDLRGRRDRTARATLQLNGGGGEIYRDFWKLPDRALSPEAFLKSKYDAGVYDACVGTFSAPEYFGRLAAKVRRVVGIDSGRLPRQAVEMLYPLWRLRYWQALNNAINNQFAYALTPFCEPDLCRQSFGIPMPLKQSGILAAALIANCDHGLARHASSYGFDFVTGPTHKARLKESAVRAVPIGLRPALRRFKAGRRRSTLPPFLEPEFALELLGRAEWEIHQFLDPFALSDHNMRSRALSLELLQRRDVL